MRGGGKQIYMTQDTNTGTIHNNINIINNITQITCAHDTQRVNNWVESGDQVRAFSPTGARKPQTSHGGRRR